MDSVATILEPGPYALVEHLWHELDDRFGLRGIGVTPIPHFSWQIAAGYRFDVVESVLREVAREAKPMTVRTRGLGVFEGDAPVVFVAVERTRDLEELHEALWERLLPLATSASPYYRTGTWVPHITLAQHDIDRERLLAVNEFLSKADLDWTVRVANLAVIEQPAGETARLRARFDFVPETST
ncbi:MAG: 2'-5' RNA ligase family protein [Firmicutes bacterium]|nr:2'-5' RNA ligase family protein [Bacillota bacterium]